MKKYNSPIKKERTSIALSLSIYLYIYIYIYIYMCVCQSPFLSLYIYIYIYMCVYFGLLNHVVTWKLAHETQCVVCIAKCPTNYGQTQVKQEGTGRDLLSPILKCASPCLRDVQPEILNKPIIMTDIYTQITNG
jgi:hypothetical protein